MRRAYCWPEQNLLSSRVYFAALQLLEAQAAAAAAAKLQQQMQACHQAALQAAQQELDEQQEAHKLQLEEQQLSHRRELWSLQQKLANMQARMEVQQEVRGCCCCSSCVFAGTAAFRQGQCACLHAPTCVGLLHCVLCRAGVGLRTDKRCCCFCHPAAL
jgi:Flp pilus assembly protein TadB